MHPKPSPITAPPYPTYRPSGPETDRVADRRIVLAPNQLPSGTRLTTLVRVEELNPTPRSTLLYASTSRLNDSIFSFALFNWFRVNASSYHERPNLAT